MEDRQLSSEQFAAQILDQVKDLSLDELVERGTLPLMCVDQFQNVQRWALFAGLRSGRDDSTNRWDNKTIGADSMMGERSLHNPEATLRNEQTKLSELAFTANVRYYTMYMVVLSNQTSEQTVTGEKVRQVVEMNPGLRKLLEVPSKPKDRTMDIHGLLTVAANRNLIRGTQDLQRERRQYMTVAKPGDIRLKLNRFYVELMALADIVDAIHKLDTKFVEAHRLVFEPLGWAAINNVDSTNP